MLGAHRYSSRASCSIASASSSISCRMSTLPSSGQQFLFQRRFELADAALGQNPVPSPLRPVYPASDTGRPIFGGRLLPLRRPEFTDAAPGQCSAHSQRRPIQECQDVCLHYNVLALAMHYSSSFQRCLCLVRFPCCRYRPPKLCTAFPSPKYSELDDAPLWQLSVLSPLCLACVVADTGSPGSGGRLLLPGCPGLANANLGLMQISGRVQHRLCLVQPISPHEACRFFEIVCSSLSFMNVPVEFTGNLQRSLCRIILIPVSMDTTKQLKTIRLGFSLFVGDCSRYGAVRNIRFWKAWRSTSVSKSSGFITR